MTKKDIPILAAEIERIVQAAQPKKSVIAAIVKQDIVFDTMPDDDQLLREAVKAWLFYAYVWAERQHSITFGLLNLQFTAWAQQLPIESTLDLQVFQDYFNSLEEHYYTKYKTSKSVVVFTPLEVVDFMLKSSIDQAIQTLTTDGDLLRPVQFIEPFCGYGIFTARLYEHLKDTTIVVSDIMCKELSVFNAIMCRIFVDNAHFRVCHLSDKPCLLPRAKVYCGDVFNEDQEWL